MSHARSTALLALGVALGVSTVLPAPLGAQRSFDDVREAERAAGATRFSRKALFSGYGAALGVGFYFLYDRLSLGGTRGSDCQPDSCALPYLTIAGALAGFFMGYESDNQYALRYRYGSPISLSSRSFTLDGEGTSMALRDSLIAVAGVKGVEIIAGGPRQRSVAMRASGFAGLSAVDFVGDGSQLGVASGTSVSLLPTLDGRGRLVREGGAEALVSTPSGMVIGAGTTVEIIPTGDVDSLGPWPAVELQSPVRALRWDSARQLLWAGTDSALIALSVRAGQSPVVVNTIDVGGSARRVSVAAGADQVAVAIGNRGLVVLDIDARGSERSRSSWAGAQYVYDAAFVKGHIYAAAGVEGLYRLELNDGTLRSTGLAREGGFAAVMETMDDVLYVLDRSGRALVRVTP